MHNDVFLLCVILRNTSHNIHNHVQFQSCFHTCLGNTPPFWNFWRLGPTISASNICETMLETRKMFITVNFRIITTNNVIQ
jgi:hypothetical protein